MDKLTDKITSSIRQTLEKSTIRYFGAAWQRHIKCILMDESRYARLLEWINNELAQDAITVCIFNPAALADDKEFYTKEVFEMYKTALLNQSLLIHARETILHDECTEQQRETVEKMVCKIFNIHYCKMLDCYMLGKE